MLTGKDISKRLPIENYIDTEINQYFHNMNIGNFNFIDEIYAAINERFERIKNIGQVGFKLISDTDFISPAESIDDTSQGIIDIGSFFEDLQDIAKINYESIPEGYVALQEINEACISNSESITELIDYYETWIDDIEADIKNNLTHNSIKEEGIIYDNISNNTYLKTGDLTVNNTAGVVILPTVSEKQIPYQIEITCDKPKGQRAFPIFGSSTWSSIKNGYFHTRTFAEQPNFENEADASLTKLKDNRMDTHYGIEYNSFSKDVDMNIKLNIRFDPTRIDAISAVFEPYGNESILSVNNRYPLLRNIFIEGKQNNDNFSEDISREVVNNVLKIDENEVGRIEDRIEYNYPDVFPAATYLLNRSNLHSITMDYLCDSPQEIYYPEQIIYDFKGNITHRFNYFETLVVNDYNAPAGKEQNADVEGKLLTDPDSYYNATESNSLIEIISNSYDTVIDKVALFRYFFGIKDLKLLRYTFKEHGEVISSNLNNSGKTIATVELYVNEIIKPYTDIKYYISSDQSTWYEISPSNRFSNSSLPRRAVFSGFEPAPRDLVINNNATEIYLKVSMDGKDNVTPVLNTYALKVKYI